MVFMQLIIYVFKCMCILCVDHAFGNIDVDITSLVNVCFVFSSCVLRLKLNLHRLSFLRFFSTDYMVAYYFHDLT